MGHCIHPTPSRKIRHKGTTIQFLLNRQWPKAPSSIEWPGFRESCSLLGLALASSLWRRSHKHQDTLLFHSGPMNISVFYFFVSWIRLPQASPLTTRLWVIFCPSKSLAAPTTWKQMNRNQSGPSPCNVCLLHQSCATHQPDTDQYKQALSFQDNCNTIRKKPTPFHPSLCVEKAISTKKYVLLCSCAKL